MYLKCDFMLAHYLTLSYNILLYKVRILYLINLIEDRHLSYQSSVIMLSWIILYTYCIVLKYIDIS